MSQVNTKLIRLWSEQASEDVYKFYTNFNTAQLNRISGISLKTCCFRNTHPNIFAEDEWPAHPLNNDVFSYTVGGTTHTITIATTGFYTLNEVFTELNPQLQIDYAAQNPGGTAVLSIGPRGKVICTITGAVAASLTFNGSKSNLNGYIGNTKDLSISAAGVAVFDSFPELGGLKMATVSVKTKSPQTILNADPNKERHTNSIGAIPITVPWKAMQSFIDPSPLDSMLRFDPPEHLRQVQFVIRDELGRIVRSQGLSFGVEMVALTAQ